MLTLCGIAWNPPRWLRVGDQVTIETIGALTHPVANEPETQSPRNLRLSSASGSDNRF